MPKPAATLLWVALYTFCLTPLAPLWAQEALPVAENELTEPLIQHLPPDEPAAAGAPFEVDALIPGAIEDATLLYRKMGELEYTPIRMKNRGKGRFTARIPKKEMTPPGIEYFIQASDGFGTTTIYGQPEPLGGFSQQLRPIAVPVEALPPARKEDKALKQDKAPKEDKALSERVFPAEKKQTARKEPSAGTAWYKKWWVWTIFGVVAVGAVAASKGKGDPESQPPSGTLTISGPTPGSP
jgi:hypothetical protein